MTLQWTERWTGVMKIPVGWVLPSLATGVTAAALMVPTLATPPTAHADNNSFIGCLNDEHVNSLGRNQDWWIGLGHAVAGDSERGVYDATIEQELMRAGFSHQDAENALECAVVTLRPGSKW
jgi:hypothetical protein